MRECILNMSALVDGWFGAINKKWWIGWRTIIINAFWFTLAHTLQNEIIFICTERRFFAGPAWSIILIRAWRERFCIIYLNLLLTILELINTFHCFSLNTSMTQLIRWVSLMEKARAHTRETDELLLVCWHCFVEKFIYWNRYAPPAMRFEEKFRYTKKSGINSWILLLLFLFIFQILI